MNVKDVINVIKKAKDIHFIKRSLLGNQFILLGENLYTKKGGDDFNKLSIKINDNNIEINIEKNNGELEVIVLEKSF